MSDFERADRGHARGTERAKPLPRVLPPRSNPVLQSARFDAAVVLSLALVEKEEAIAASLGVTRTVPARWLNPEFADARPAPLALLLAIDDAQFAAVVRGLEAMRKARRER